MAPSWHAATRIVRDRADTRDRRLSSKSDSCRARVPAAAPGIADPPARNGTGPAGLDPAGPVQQCPQVVAIRQDLLDATSCLDELVPDLLRIGQGGLHLSNRLPGDLLDLVGVGEGLLYLGNCLACDVLDLVRIRQGFLHLR